MQILFAEDVIVLLRKFSSGTLSTNKDVGRVDYGNDPLSIHHHLGILGGGDFSLNNFAVVLFISQASLKVLEVSPCSKVWTESCGF